MKELIITADDYGMSPAVNKAIEEGINAGLITSTNVMTDMPYYKQAAGLISNSNVSVGLHWNVSCGKSVLPRDEISTLVDNNGFFFSADEFVTKYKEGRIDISELKSELVAQYKNFITEIGTPAYWNTHENTHVHIGLYEFFLKTALELGLKRMRSHQRIYIHPKTSADAVSLKWKILEPLKVLRLNSWQSGAHKAGVSSPCGLILCLGKDDETDLDYLFGKISESKKSVGELCIHPACEIDSPFFGDLTQPRIDEYKAYTNKNTFNIIKASGIELVNYTVCDRFLR